MNVRLLAIAMAVLAVALFGARVHASVPAQTGDGALEGIVFLDEDGDGQLAATEDGLASFMVQLEREDGSISTRQTNRGGNYRFSNLEAGRYTVRLVERSGYAKSGIDVYLNVEVKDDGRALEGIDFAVIEVDEDEMDEDEAADEDADADEDVDADADEDADSDDAMMSDDAGDSLDAMAAAVAGGELPAGMSAEMSAMIADLDDAQAEALSDALAERDEEQMADVAAELSDAQRAMLAAALRESGADDMAMAAAGASMATDADAASDDGDDEDDGDHGDDDDDDEAVDEDNDGREADVDDDDGDDDGEGDHEGDGADTTDEAAPPSNMPEAGLADLGGPGLLALLALVFAAVGGFGMWRERSLNEA